MVAHTVTFFKQVRNSEGHLFKASQEKITLQARDHEEAVRKAKNLFTDLRRIPHWMLHADTFEVATLCPATCVWHGKRRSSALGDVLSAIDTYGRGSDELVWAIRKHTSKIAAASFPRRRCLPL
jgi:hypothetical protein